MVPATVLTLSKPVPISVVRPVSTDVHKIKSTKNESVFEEDIKLLKLEVQLRDNALVSLRQTLEKAEQEMDDLKLKLEKFQTSFKNLTELLASQTNAKTGSDESLPPSPIYDRYQSGNGYHAVPPPYTGTFIPPKPDLVFNNAPNDVETDHPAFILNGDSLAPTRVVDGVLQPVAPTTAEHRLARKNELKACGFSSESLDQIHDKLQKLISQLEILRVSLSQEDINFKFLRSLPSEWMTHTLIWRNKTNLEEQSLDDL
nr:hypothetical protein [Tanacetum cinerariifolium]